MYELGRLFLHGGADPPDQRLGDVLVMNLQTKADFTALMHKFLDPSSPVIPQAAPGCIWARRV